MPRVIFQYADGSQRAIEIAEGWTVMEGARHEGLAGIVAECGGGAICGTCHVRIDPAWYQHFDAPEDIEAALLEMVPERGETSRLACQLVLSAKHDGLSVCVPSRQFGND